MHQEKLKVLDLFSGIGGFSLGLENTGGFTTVAFCEQDKKARAVLNKHWPNVPIHDDVRTLKGTDVEGPIDVICGGFPCQDISIAGKGAGLSGERSGLWFEFLRLIEETKPSWALIENVSALRSRGLDTVLRGLTEIGYDAEWHCITAASVGAPHRRDRIWIVGYPKVVQRNGCNADSEDGCTPTPELGSSGCQNPMAYPSSQRGPTRGEAGYLAGSQGEGQGDSEERQRDGHASDHCSSVVADTHSTRLSFPWFTREEGSTYGCKSPTTERSSWWAVEPNVGRVAHGVPGRVDRLKQLGNAVVPAIPERIGRAILAHHKKNNSGDK